MGASRGSGGERATSLGAELWRAARFLGPPEERWTLLLPLAVLVGLLSGAGAVGLREAVHVVFASLQGLRGGPAGLLLPAAGALVGVLVVTRLFREPPGHGVPEVIRAVCRQGGRLPGRAMFSRWLGSLVNVGAGGSAGLEGPIVYTGAAVGSFVGGRFRLDERRRSVLLATGVAAGISAIFNAPMTGVIFAMEVVLAEWSAFAIVPIVVGAVVATELSRSLLGDSSAFLHVPFAMGTRDLVLCALLGLVAGLSSTALTRIIARLHALARHLPRHALSAPVLFGLGVGAIGVFAPGAIGEGYDTVQLAIRSDLREGLLLAAVLLGAKLLATGLTIGSGAPGGVFAPCLVLGSLLGVGFHRLASLVLPRGYPIGLEGSYALVGMAGLLAGVLQAPLTAIFLVLEITGGYEVILPLMIVSVLSLLVTRRFQRYSMYTVELAERGELLRPGTDRRILADVGVRETLDVDAQPVREDMTLADFARAVRHSRRNHFPVLDAAGERFVGMLELGLVREVLGDPQLTRVTLVGTLCDRESPTLPLQASLADALEVFERTGAWVLPVLAPDGRFAGLLSKSTLFDHYRRELSVQTSVSS